MNEELKTKCYALGWGYGRLCMALGDRWDRGGSHTFLAASFPWREWTLANIAAFRHGLLGSGSTLLKDMCAVADVISPDDVNALSHVNAECSGAFEIGYWHAKAGRPFPPAKSAEEEGK